jgi:hypothetical protein
MGFARLFCYPDVKTNSTLLQSALRADFPLLFPENRGINYTR